MTDVLVVYATREGQTRKVATTIAGHLRASGANVQLVDAGDSEAASRVELEAADLVVCGASMHAGGLEKELVQFVNGNAERLSALPRSFFLVLLSAATRDESVRARWIADAEQKVNEQLRVTFDDTEMVAGALTYSKYPWPLKWLMRRIARQAGGDTDTSRDYEYTDWEQVERYAGRLVRIAERRD